MEFNKEKILKKKTVIKCKDFEEWDEVIEEFQLKNVLKYEDLMINYDCIDVLADNYDHSKHYEYCNYNILTFEEATRKPKKKKRKKNFIG